jgi:hypothetical protein
MRLRMGNQIFVDVNIPVLWGTRAVIQDRDGHLSVINLGGTRARLEILADKPAPKAHFIPTFDGFSVLSNNREELYSYSPDDRKLTSLSLDLPNCRIRSDAIEIGTNVFSNNVITGSGVGIKVTKDGISIGGPLPSNLADLVV